MGSETSRALGHGPRTKTSLERRVKVVQARLVSPDAADANRRKVNKAKPN